MAFQFSTGLRQYLLGEGSVRKAFEDSIIKVFGGTAPANADAAETGVLLCTVTKASLAVTPGDRSTPRAYEIAISGTITTGNVVSINVTVDGVGPTAYPYTILAADDSRLKIAAKVARMLNDIAQIRAIPDIDDASGLIYVLGSIDGLNLTLADVPGTCATTVTEKQAAVRTNCIQLANPVAGVIGKEAAVNSGINVAAGTASHFRLILPSDTGVLSTTQVRLQGTVGISGTDWVLNSTNFAIGATTTVSEIAITIPATAT